jgi:hypothetical protein
LHRFVAFVVSLSPSVVQWLKVSYLEQVTGFVPGNFCISSYIEPGRTLTSSSRSEFGRMSWDPGNPSCTRLVARTCSKVLSISEYTSETLPAQLANSMLPLESSPYVALSPGSGFECRLLWYAGWLPTFTLAEWSAPQNEDIQD